MINVIEFQKHGFPYAHIVIRVQSELPVKQIDKIVNAELPHEQSHLKNMVEKYIVHKQQHSSRSDHINYTINNTSENSSRQPINEFKDYINGRYLSAAEAAWRIFRYPITTSDLSKKDNPVQTYEFPIFLDRKAGYSKIFLINAICYTIQAAGEIVLTCRTTALLALLYEGGHTAYSLFRIPVEENNINIQSTIKYMTVLDSVDILLQQICKSNKLFGEKPLIGVGNFRQKYFHRYVLNQPIRNANNPIFVKFIDNISENYKNYEISLNIFKTTRNIEEATLFLYPENILSDNNILQKRAFLSSCNSLVDDFNYKILNKLPRTIHTYFSYDIIKENDEIITDHSTTTPDYLAQLTYLIIKFT
ncbi:3354_t:CDS:2 [Scutellospora calospora]|uniref:3354_t:CDS:1 n=1 Tax=Scutellospora calospora TaxID=85575 RepID=A0ACA9JU93_9GLOM|nr:3354_t:CDS:2 [Scutellospora calospora]